MTKIHFAATVACAAVLAPTAGRAAPLTPAEVREVEDRVLAARKALRTGQMVIAYRITDGAGKHLPDRDYRVHIWWDGHRVRTDHVARPADPAPVRTITCWHCERDGLRFHHSPDPKNPAVIEAAFGPITPADEPAQRPPDPRALGLIPFPFLNCYGKPLDTLIGRPNRSNVRGERAGDREEVTIEFDASPTLRARARVEPAKGDVVTRVEWLTVGPDGKTGAATWTLETTYKEVRRAGAWFPAEFTYTETAGGKETERHQGRVTEVFLNDRVDPGLFTIAGLGLPPGTVINHVPPGGDLMEWTGTKLKLFDPRKPAK